MTTVDEPSSAVTSTEKAIVELQKSWPRNLVGCSASPCATYPTSAIARAMRRKTAERTKSGDKREAFML